MKAFVFKTTTTMKAYNAKHWYIDPGIVREIQVDAETLNEALSLYAEIVQDKYCIGISKHALRNKSAMYIATKTGESKQIGYVITGKTDFQTEYGRWTEQYIDLWVTVLTIVHTEF